jgi:hypothetical protein
MTGRGHLTVSPLPDPEYLPKTTIGERVARGRGPRAALDHDNHAR